MQSLARQVGAEIRAQKLALTSAKMMRQLKEYLTSQLTFVTMSTRKSFSLMPHESIVATSGKILPNRAMERLLNREWGGMIPE